MAKKNKKPEVRFKGYTENWKVKKAESLCSISTGKNNTQDKIDRGKYPFYVRSATIERSNGYLFDEEAVLTVGDGVGTGKVYHYVNGKYDLHQRVYRMFDFKEVSGKYFFYFFSNNFQKRVIEMTAKSSVDSVRLEMISNMDIMYPELIKEQDDITCFFQNIENLITHHQKKHDKLVVLKKAMLEKMFPKNRTKVPEIRFKEFTKDWKEQKLKEIASDISDGNWIESNHVFEKGEYRIIQTGNLGLGKFLNKSKHAKYFHQKDFNEVRGNEIFPGDILISRLAEPAGRTIILPSTGFRMVTAVDVTIIRPDKDIFDAYFLITQLNTNNILKVINKRVSGTSHRRISRRNLEKTKLIVPVIEEQRKIGEYFKSLDKQIALHKTQLDKLNNIKKACFTKMFVAHD
jgi:type I restriction enzyme S subunit